MGVVPKIIFDVVKNLFKKPFTVRYPKTRVPIPPGYRGKIEFFDRCIGCKLCQNNCPADAIHVYGRTVRARLDRCMSCGECVRVCPVKNIALSLESDNVAETRETIVESSGKYKCVKCGKEFSHEFKKFGEGEIPKVCPECEKKPFP